MDVKGRGGVCRPVRPWHGQHRPEHHADDAALARSLARSRHSKSAYARMRKSASLSGVITEAFARVPHACMLVLPGLLCLRGAVVAWRARMRACHGGTILTHRQGGNSLSPKHLARALPVCRLPCAPAGRARRRRPPAGPQRRHAAGGCVNATPRTRARAHAFLHVRHAWPAPMLHARTVN